MIVLKTNHHFPQNRLFWDGADDGLFVVAFLEEVVYWTIVFKFLR
jgi:hypothetical protein